MGPEASHSGGDPKGAEMQNAVAEQRVQDNALAGPQQFHFGIRDRPARNRHGRK